MLTLIVTFLSALADQWTKEVVRQQFALHEVRPVVDGFFSFTYVRNTGAAWGMFGGHTVWLIVLSFVMLALMIVFRRVFLSNTLAHRVALGLLAGGILGNLFDRLRMGYVTDFLLFEFGSYAFPSFNIADSCISVGVGIYILSTFAEDLARKRAGTGEAERTGTSGGQGGSSA